jgi:hypothetical protein
MKLVGRDRRARRKSTAGVVSASPPKGERIEVRGLFSHSGLQTQNPHPTLSLAKGEANQAPSQIAGNETRSRPVKRRN